MLIFATDLIRFAFDSDQGYYQVMNPHKFTHPPRQAHKISRSFFAVAFLLITNWADAGLITFETTPFGSTPSDNTDISASYPIDGGGSVQFFFDANANLTYEPLGDILPQYERTGTDAIEGFQSTFGPGFYDTARPGLEGQLGNYFLKQPNPRTTTTPLVIRYDTTQSIRAFSGEIWDIDGDGVTDSEQWRVDALDAGGIVIGSITSLLGTSAGVNSGDSRAWEFSFENLSADLQTVRLTFIGTRETTGGWGFNNFSPTEAILIPEPGSFGIALTGLWILGIRFQARRIRNNPSV